jgi:hypothetical protein
MRINNVLVYPFIKSFGFKNSSIDYNGKDICDDLYSMTAAVYDSVLVETACWLNQHYIS